MIFLMPRSMAGVCYSKSNEKAMMKISNGIYPQISITHKRLWMTSISGILPSLEQPADGNSELGSSKLDGNALNRSMHLMQK